MENKHDHLYILFMLKVTKT